MCLFFSVEGEGFHGPSNNNASHITIAETIAPISLQHIRTEGCKLCSTYIILPLPYKQTNSSNIPDSFTKKEKKTISNYEGT